MILATNTDYITSKSSFGRRLPSIFFLINAHFAATSNLENIGCLRIILLDSVPESNMSLLVSIFEILEHSHNPS